MKVKYFLPTITQKLLVASFIAAYQPLMECRVEERAVVALPEESSKLVHTLPKVMPLNKSVEATGIDCLIDLIGGQRVQRGEADIEDHGDILEQPCCLEAHSQMEEDLSEVYWKDLVVGALENEWSILNEVEKKLAVEEAAASESSDMCDQLRLKPDAACVNVVLDFRHHIDTMVLVGADVAGNKFTHCHFVKADTREWERTDDILLCCVHRRDNL